MAESLTNLALKIKTDRFVEGHIHPESSIWAKTQNEHINNLAHKGLRRTEHQSCPWSSAKNSHRTLIIQTANLNQRRNVQLSSLSARPGNTLVIYFKQKVQPGTVLVHKRLHPLKHSIKLGLTGGGWVSVLIGLLLRHVAPPPGRGQIFKHGRVVGGQHVLQV